jgi:hypothetical protein
MNASILVGTCSKADKTLIDSGRNPLEAIAPAQIAKSQRYVQWARGLALSVDHKLPIEIA